MNEFGAGIWLSSKGLRLPVPAGKVQLANKANFSGPLVTNNGVQGEEAVCVFPNKYVHH